VLQSTGVATQWPAPLQASESVQASPSLHGDSAGNGT
jgi:hypothetical protein